MPSIANSPALWKSRRSRSATNAEAMARISTSAGALAFKLPGDPFMGIFSDAVVLKTFGEVPDGLDKL